MIWPTHSLSMKTLATHLDFRWRDTDPSGAGSIQWFHQWVESGDASIRKKILEYNEDDGRAMRVLVDALRNLTGQRLGLCRRGLLSPELGQLSRAGIRRGTLEPGAFR